MPWPLYLALKQLFPSGRKWPTLFFFIAVLGVSLGVMILIIVQSVMGGFGQTYREKIVATSGHLQIATGAILYDYREIVEQVQAHPQVEAISPYAQGVVMLQHYTRTAFPMVRGIDQIKESQVIPMQEFLVWGTLDQLNDDGVLLSQELAHSVGAWLDDTVEVYTPLLLEKLKQDEILLPRELKVVGIYRTGWNYFDTSTMVVTLPLMQELYGLEEGVHGLAVRLQDGADEIKVAQELEQVLPLSARAITWLDQYADFLWVLKLEKNMMLFLLLFIVIVAVFAIAISQLLTVLRKTREIGLIGAMGAQPSGVALTYCVQGFFLGLLGNLLGIGFAITALSFRNPIIHTIAKFTGSEATLVKFYQFDNLPVHYSTQDFLVITLSALFLSTLAGLVPAIRAAMMKPADALRFE